MRKWLFGILILGLLLLGCTLSISDFGVLSKFDMSATAMIQTATEVINLQLTTTQRAFGWATSSDLSREDFLGTATQLVYSTTQTADSMYADCESVTVTFWEIFYRISNAELSEYTYENATYSFYDCPTDAERLHREYRLTVATDDLSDRNMIIQSIEYLIGQLPLYPPDDSPLQDEHLISLFIFFDDGEFHYQIGAPFEFTYENAIAAYERGLRGAELLDALGIEVPE